MAYAKLNTGPIKSETKEENIREKIIKKDLETANKRFNILTDWEKEFLSSIESQIKEGKELSTKQFNTLQELARK